MFRTSRPGKRRGAPLLISAVVAALLLPLQAPAAQAAPAAVGAPAAVLPAASPDAAFTVTCDTPGYMFNTGINTSSATPSILPTGALDQRWTFAQGTIRAKMNGTTKTPYTYPTTPASVEVWPSLADAATGTYTPATVGNLAVGAWKPSPYSTAQWLGTRTPVDYSFIYYRLVFDIDPAVDLNAFTLQPFGSIDDYLMDIFVNGTSMRTTLGDDGQPLFQPTVNPFSWSRSPYFHKLPDLRGFFQHGRNEIVLAINNDTPPSGMVLSTQKNAQLCSPVMNIVKSGPAKVLQGKTASYTIEVSNTKASPEAKNVVVSDDYAGGDLSAVSWTCSASGGATCPQASGTGKLSQTIPSLVGPDQKLTYTVTATVVSGNKTITNTATVAPPSDGTITCADGVAINNAGACYDTSTATSIGKPVAVADSSTTPVATPVTIDSVANDSDPQGQALTLGTPSNPAHGAVTKAGNTFVYTPDAGFVGTDTFTYAVTNEDGLVSNTATVTVTVTATLKYDGNGNTGGTPPPGVVDTPNPTQNVAGKGSLERDGYAFVGWNTRADGSGTAYAPGDEIVLKAATTSLYAQWSRVPVVNDDAASTPTGSAVTIDALANDTNPGQSLTLQAPSAPGRGTVKIVNGEFVYTPDAGFVGTDSFTYAVKNQDGVGSGTATVSIDVWANLHYDGNGSTGGAAPADVLKTSVTPQTVGDRGTLVRDGHVFLGWNTAADGSGTGYAPDAKIALTKLDTTLFAQWREIKAPTAVDDSSSGPLGDQQTIDALGNDSDPQGLTLTLQAPGAPAHGTVEIVNGSFVYTPEAGFVGTDSFTYTVKNEDGALSNTATVTVRVWANLHYDGNGSTSGAAPADVLKTSVTPQTVGDRGTLVRDSYVFLGWNAAADGSGTAYAPDAKIALTKLDTTLFAQWREIKAPTAVDDASSGPTPEQQTIDALGNDSDPQGLTLTLQSPSAPAHGTVKVVDGSFVYTPEEGFLGADSFTYTVKNEDGAVSNSATVTVRVWANLHYDGNGATGGSAPSDVLKTTTSPQTVEGRNTLVRDGHVFLGWNTAADGSGTAYAPGSKIALKQRDTTLFAQWRTITPPTAVDDKSTGVTGDAQTIDALGNDSDPQGLTLTLQSPSAPAHGTVKIVDGAFVYTPQDGFVGTDSFTYTVKNEDGAVSNTATARIDVTASLVYDGNGSTGGEVPAGVVNTTQASQQVAGPGTMSRFGYVFTGWNSSATPAASTAAARLAPNTAFAPGSTIVLDAPVTTLYAQWRLESVPVAKDDASRAVTGAKQGVDALANDTDPLGQELTPNVFTQPGHGTVAWVGGRFVYTPRAGFVGTDSFTYSVKNADGAVSNTATVRLEVFATLRYDGNGKTGGEVPPTVSETTTPDQSVAGQASMVREGFEFLGWNSKADGSGILYLPGSIVTLDAPVTTLYAHWRLLEEPPSSTSGPTQSSATDQPSIPPATDGSGTPSGTQSSAAPTRSSSGTGLPETGATVWPALGLGLLLVIAGGGALGLRRSRRSHG